MDFKKEAGLFVPFNFIKHAPEGEAGNMELTSMKKDSITIPLYRNTRPLDRGDELLLDSVSRMLDSACGEEGKEVFSMKLQRISVCLNKGAQAVPARFLGSIAWACKELRCVHPVLVTSWKLVSFGRLL